MFLFHGMVNKMNIRPYRKQAGAILVMFTIGLFSLLVVAAMALDGGHMLLNKGRLQNAVDAAAIGAAKVLQGEGTLFEARQEATSILIQNLQYDENSELDNGVNLSVLDYNLTQVAPNLFIEFSEWPDPFSPVLDEGTEYVRVRIENVGLDNFIAQIINFNKFVRASAVAGRSTDIECIDKVVPMMVCGYYPEPNLPELVEEGKPFGIPLNELFVMKGAAQQTDSIGPGNFQLLRLGDNKGGDDISKALAGEYSYDACVSAGDEIPTETGNTAGPVAKGINTRFGEWTGNDEKGPINSIDHKRDADICEGQRIQVDEDVNIIVDADGNPVDELGNIIDYYHYDQYAPPPGTDRPNSCPELFNGNILRDATTLGGRREIPVVIGICDGMTNGSNTITAVGTGCFFLTQKVSDQTPGKLGYVVGEFVSTCSSEGAASFDPNFVSNTSTIVLYRDPDSPDS